MTIGKICIRDVHLADSTEPVQVAAQRMKGCKVGLLVILNSDQKPIGVVTDRDLTLKVIAKGLDPQRTVVGDVMTPSPHTIREEASIEHALQLMRGGPFRRLPVVDDRDRLVGIVSLDDVLGLLTEEFEAIGSLLRREAPPRMPRAGFAEVGAES